MIDNKFAHEESNRAYQQGLEDAWEVVQNITKGEDKGGYSDEMLADLFRNLSIHMIVQRYAPQDVIRMIKEYEKKRKQDENEVGDVLDKIKEEINGLIKYYPYPVVSPYQTNNYAMLMKNEVLKIIDKYMADKEE